MVGPGTNKASVQGCESLLRRLLYPNYGVRLVGEDGLLKEPWTTNCALLVMPGGADVNYCRILNGAGNRSIAEFVRNGGRYLGLCAGSYYASKTCEFEMGNTPLEVVGDRELAFFPGTCRGSAFRGFEYGTENGARVTRLALRTGAFPPSTGVPDSVDCYCNGGGVFVDAASMAARGVQVLADYDDHIDVAGGSGKAAVVYCDVGAGAVLLSGPHPE